MRALVDVCCVPIWPPEVAEEFYERNERGFHDFLLNLKSVFRMILSWERLDDLDDLNETKTRLLDASGTLALLLSNVRLGNGGTNLMGLPSNIIHAPLQNLQNSVTDLIVIVTARIENIESKVK